MYEHYIKVDLELWKSIFKGLEVSNLICWGQVKLLQYWSLKCSITNWYVSTPYQFLIAKISCYELSCKLKRLKLRILGYDIF